MCANVGMELDNWEYLFLAKKKSSHSMVIECKINSVIFIASQPIIFSYYFCMCSVTFHFFKELFLKVLVLLFCFVRLLSPLGKKTCSNLCVVTRVAIVFFTGCD